MIPSSHIQFELAVYVLLLLCAVHAWQQQERYVIYTLLAATVYGLVAELLGIHARAAHPELYTYGRFLIMLFNDTVPLCIGVGWAVIIYAVMHTAQRLNGTMPWYARPLLMGLMALSLDFIMDPVASGPGGITLWNWGGTPDRFWWFGVPLSNFVGWFVVIASFTFYTLLIRRRVPPGSRGQGVDLLMALLAVPAAFLTNFVILIGYQRLIAGTPVEPVVLVLMLGAGLAVFWRYSPTFNRRHPYDLIVLAVPAFFLIFFTLWAFWGDTIAQMPDFAYVILVAFFFSSLLFLWPLSRRRDLAVYSHL